MAGLFSRLFRRGRAHAPVAELPPAPAVAEPVVPAPEPASGEHAPQEPAVAEPEPEAEGEISPARLDAALRRLRDEHPPATESAG